jgi:hypothetical protein
MRGARIAKTRLMPAVSCFTYSCRLFEPRRTILSRLVSTATCRARLMLPWRAATSGYAGTCPWCFCDSEMMGETTKHFWGWLSSKHLPLFPLTFLSTADSSLKIDCEAEVASVTCIRKELPANVLITSSTAYSARSPYSRRRRHRLYQKPHV